MTYLKLRNILSHGSHDKYVPVFSDEQFPKTMNNIFSFDQFWVSRGKEIEENTVAESVNDRLFY